MAGKLIVIEGTDCSGKETQSKLAVDTLRQLGYQAIYFSFPMYDTPTGKIIGGALLGKKEIGTCLFPEGYVSVDPKVISLFMAADRKYNIGKIQEYLDKDYYVILDRYVSSNMAHQGSKIMDADERFYMYQWIDKLEYWLLNLPKPSKTILLHVPYQMSMKLMKERNSLDEAEKDEEHLRLSEKAYLELVDLYHWSKVSCFYENRLKSIDEIHEEVMKEIC